MRHRILVLAIALVASGPAAATPVFFTLEDPYASDVRVRLLAYDAFDSVLLVNQEVVPSGGSANGDLLGTLDPGLDISRFSLAWDVQSYNGIVPNVGAFTLTLNSFEVNFFGDPILNERGRVKPTQNRTFLAVSSTGAPSGTLSVDGNAVDFAFGALDCSSGLVPNSCFSRYGDPTLTTTDLTDIGVGSASTDGATPPWQATVLSVGDVNFRVRIENLSASGARYVVPEPTTALLLAVGLAGLAAAGRRRLR